MEFAAKADAFHEAPGRGVVGEAAGHDTVQAKFVEAHTEELPDGFGGVAMSGVRWVEYPGKLGLAALPVRFGFLLCPGVLDAEHEVTNDLATALDDEGGGEALR